jgi:hypothetical protein
MTTVLQRLTKIEYISTRPKALAAVKRLEEFFTKLTLRGRGNEKLEELVSLAEDGAKKRNLNPNDRLGKLREMIKATSNPNTIEEYNSVLHLFTFDWTVDLYRSAVTAAGKVVQKLPTVKEIKEIMKGPPLRLRKCVRSRL